MLSKGQRINGRYEIVKTIGEGGMANVYLAVDVLLNRNVAIKVLRGDLASDDKFIRRFQREAKSVSDLSHPNIVEVYDVGEEFNQYYIVMEYIEGKTLKQLIHKRGNLTVAEVVDIMAQITDGLAHAHDAYIIHRDIKPQNIMILDNGIVKITDFGIAMALNATQLTQTNSVMGSVHYLPPEQASGKAATVKSDIYSAGILMYELLTGSVPFKGENAVEIALKQMKEKIPSVRASDPMILQSVENIVLKATAKNPKNRYESVRDMHNDLMNCLSLENEVPYEYPYPENDMEPTKVVPTVSPEMMTEKVVEKVVEVSEKEGTGNKYLWIFLTVLLIAGIAACVGLIIFSGSEPKDVRVPNVVNMTVDEAILKLEEVGLTYTTTTAYSNTVEEGYVIKTTPKAGSTRKKGSTITIVESSGSNSYLLEDLSGQDYRDVKALLKTYNINVIITKKDVENPDEYIGKEDLIIEQQPAFDANNATYIAAGDTVTLFIPNIINGYPDMVSEGWSLSDVEAFADEYSLTLDVSYKETDTVEAGTVISQSRPAGDTIVAGITLRVVIAKEITKVSETEEDNTGSDNSEDNGNTSDNLDNNN